MPNTGPQDLDISKLQLDQDIRYHMSDGSHILKDNCLRLIFEYLPIVDRIRFERVCKNWQQSFRGFWRDVHSLNFKKEVWGIRMPLDLFEVKITLNIIKNVLLRCGENLKIVDFEYYDSNYDNGEVGLVAQCCPQLEQLNFPCLVKSEGLVTLTDHCKKITSLSMGFHITDFQKIKEVEEKLGLLFHKNPRLRQIYFVSKTVLDWQCLNYLHQEIEFIALTQVSFMFMDCLDVVKKFPKLIGLVINTSSDIDDERIESITSCLALKFLKLKIQCFLEIRRPNNILNRLSSLINLQELDVSRNDLVDDRFLIHISTKLEHLRYLNIARCGAVTNAGIMSLTSFKNLKYLNVGKLHMITDDPFGALFNLSWLLCYDCRNIHEHGLIQLIQCSEELEHLDVSSCREMTNKLVEAAVCITKERIMKLILNLYIEDTSIRMYEANNTSPSLKVIQDKFHEEKLPISELGRRTPLRAGRFYQFR